MNQHKKYTQSGICQLSSDTKCSHVNYGWWKFIFLQQKQLPIFRPGRLQGYVIKFLKY